MLVEALKTELLRACTWWWQWCFVAVCHNRCFCFSSLIDIRYEEDFPVLKAAFSSAPLPDIRHICFKPEPHAICQIARALLPGASCTSGLQEEQRVTAQLLRLSASVEMCVAVCCCVVMQLKRLCNSVTSNPMMTSAATPLQIPAPLHLGKELFFKRHYERAGV